MFCSQATQVDNSDRYALATLSVRRAGPTGAAGPAGGAGPTPASAGATPVRFRRKQFSASVSEAAAPGHVLLTLDTVPPADSRQVSDHRSRHRDRYCTYSSY